MQDTAERIARTATATALAAGDRTFPTGYVTVAASETQDVTSELAADGTVTVTGTVGTYWCTAGIGANAVGLAYEVAVAATCSDQAPAGPAPSTTPQAPSIHAVTAGDGQVTVAFTASGDGGEAVTNYDFSVDDGATWTPRNPASTASPLTIAGLVNGTSYTVRIRAVNSVGAGTASEGVLVTPSAPGWTLGASAGGTERIVGVAAAADGSSVVTGRYNIPLTLGEQPEMASAPGGMLFVANVSPSGAWLWATPAGGGVTVQDIARLNDGSAVVVGSFTGTATFGSLPGGGARTITASGSSEDVFAARISPAGVWQWASRAGSNAADSARSVTVADDGSILIAGNTNASASSPAVFGSLPGIVSAGNSDVFVAEVATDGTWQWVTRAGSTSGEFALDIAADADGGAYVVGQFSGLMAFPGIAGSLSHSGSGDGFIAKIGASGTWLWREKVGASGVDEIAGVAVTSDGGALITGGFSNTVTFPVEFPNVAPSLTSVGSVDTFVALLNSSGVTAWASQAGSTGADQGRRVSVAGGNAVVVGTFTGTITFANADPGSAASVATDGFVAVIDVATGTWTWAASFAGPGTDWPSAVASTTSSILVGGDFNANTGGTFTAPTRPVTSLPGTSTTDLFLSNVSWDGPPN